MKAVTVMRAGLVLAAAFVMAYLGMAALTHLGEFSPWAPHLGWYGLASVLCGIVLASAGYRAERTIWSVVAAAGLSVVIFGIAWFYVCWSLVRDYLSFSEVLLSNFVLVYVLQRGLAMFLVSAASCLVGVVIASFLPRWLMASSDT